MPTFVGGNFTSFINIKSITFARVMGHFVNWREIYSFSKNAIFCQNKLFLLHSFSPKIIHFIISWFQNETKPILNMSILFWIQGIHVDTHLLNTSFIRIHFWAHLQSLFSHACKWNTVICCEYIKRIDAFMNITLNCI